MNKGVCYKKQKEGIYLKIKAISKASKNEVVGIVSNRIKVVVRAPPQNGEANDAIERVISEFFSIKKSDCRVVAGHRSSLKTVFITTDIEEKIKTAIYDLHIHC